MTIPLRRRSLVGVGPQPTGAAMPIAMSSAYLRSPFAGVDWSPALIGFLAYTVAIVTYRFPIGTASMSLAILTLPFEKQGLRLPVVVALAIALVAWCFLGMFTTKYPDSVVPDVTEFAKVCGVFLVAMNVLTSRARFRAYMVLVLILFSLYPIRGTLIGYFFYGGGPEGRAAWNYAYSNPNDLAGLCILQLANCLGVLAIEKKWWVVRGTQLAVGLLALVIILTQSRGALIGLAVFGLVTGRRYLTDVKKMMMLAVLAVFIAVVAPDSAWKRFSTIQTTMESSNADMMNLDPNDADVNTRQDLSSSAQRLEIWSVARAIIAENFVAGVGLGAYPDAHFQMAQRSQFNPIARGHRDTHSTYLGMFAETGVIGFILFIAMIVLTLVHARRARKRCGKLSPALTLQLFYMEVGLYAYLVAAIWGTYGTLVPTYMHLALVGTAANLLENEAAAPSSQTRRRGAMTPPAQRHAPA